MARNISVLVLAGGRGLRMDILCKKRPKPILPMAGICRLIDFTLSNCIKSAFTSLSVVTDYEREDAIFYLNKWEKANGKNLKIVFLQPWSGTYKGTADAVFQNLDFLERESNQTVLILAGDHVYNMDYRKMLEFHLRTRADVTLGVSRVPLKDASRYGQILTDAEGKVTAFVEKPEIPVSPLVSMGIYIFNKDLLFDCLIKDAGDTASCHDFGYSILPGLVKNKRVFAFEFSDYWRDVGTIESYFQSNMDLLRIFSHSGVKQWNIYSAQQGISLEPQNRDNISNSLIGKTCRILGRVESSILGEGVVVDDGAVVRNSIILDDTYIGPDSEVLFSIIDEKVHVGPHSIIGYSPEHMEKSREISVIGRNVRLPAHCIVGQSCCITSSPPEVNDILYTIERRSEVHS